MGFDYKEYKKFVDIYIKAAREFDKFLYDFLIKCANEVLAKTKKRTPVDTGALKKNWFITKVIRKGEDLVVYLYNNQEYASYVEYGHTNFNRTRWVEGYYMATISIEELERKIPARFEREFARFIKNLEV
jgi:hypothetical protein